MRLWALLLTAFLPLAAAAAQPAPGTGDRFFVRVTVNGQPAIALLDSLAERTTLNDDFAARLGLTPDGNAAARDNWSRPVLMGPGFADPVRIELPGIVLDVPVQIADLDEMAGRLLGRPVDLQLGRALFDNHRLWVDIKTGYIERADGGPAPDGVRLPVGGHRGTPTIPAAVEGHAPVQAVFDLGHGREVLIGRAYAERLGLTAAERIVGTGGGGGVGGPAPYDIVILRSLTLAGQEFRDVRAAIDPSRLADDLTIGTPILRHFTITTDFPNRAIWLQRRRAEPASGAPSDRPPIRIQLIDGRLFMPVLIGEVQSLALLDLIATEDLVDRDFARRHGIRDGSLPDPRARRGETIVNEMRRSLDSMISVDTGLFGFGHAMPHRQLGTLGPSDSRPLDLAIGRTPFIAPRFRIDMAGGTLGFAPRWSGRGVRLPLTEIDGRPAFAVGIGGGATAQAMLDTAYGPVRVSRAFAERRGLAVAAGKARLPLLSLGGRNFTDVEAEVDPAEAAPDLAIGTSILRRFVITTAFFDGEIWLEPKE